MRRMTRPEGARENGGIPPGSPQPVQIREVRRIAGLTQGGCARMVHVSAVTWRRWEMEGDLDTARRMSAAVWELFLLGCVPIPGAAWLLSEFVPGR